MEPFFIGQIARFGGNFAPRNWALCSGQLLPISQNTALFSILGTTYGGDGRSTFGLPDLRGRYAMHPGQGPGLSNRQLGQKGGVEGVTLQLTQLPSHNHVASETGTIKVTEEDATTNEVAGNSLANSTNNNNAYTADAPNAQLHSGSLAISTTINNAGGDQSHENMAPFGTVNFIIALVGPYPSRS